MMEKECARPASRFCESPAAPGTGSEAMRVAFQGEAGAFSEAAALQLLGEEITTVPRPTFDSAFRAMQEGAADALLAPIENSLAGSVARVYDLLLASTLVVTAETILPIEHHLIGFPGVSLDDVKSVASHPMALAQCEHFFSAHPEVRRIPAEDTAGSVRQILAGGDRSAAAIAGKRAADFYGGSILAESIQDNVENFTRFLLLRPENSTRPEGNKMSLAMRLAHRPGALLGSLEPFARYGVNLLKIESRPIHGRPWEYQFFLDIEADTLEKLTSALAATRDAVSELRVLGRYPGASAHLSARDTSSSTRK
jgi:prephenate dehydratase